MDGTELLKLTDAHALITPAVLLCAPRGMVNDDHPMQPLALVRQWAAEDLDRRTAIEVPDVNRYTILLGRHGAAAVAGEVGQSDRSAGSSSRSAQLMNGAW